MRVLGWAWLGLCLALWLSSSAWGQVPSPALEAVPLEVRQAIHAAGSSGGSSGGSIQWAMLGALGSGVMWAFRTAVASAEKVLLRAIDAANAAVPVAQSFANSFGVAADALATMADSGTPLPIEVTLRRVDADAD